VEIDPDVVRRRQRRRVGAAQAEGQAQRRGAGVALDQQASAGADRGPGWQHQHVGRIVVGHPPAAEIDRGGAGVARAPNRA
jgi:hypothetical protein